jgi:hypothetical protein
MAKIIISGLILAAITTGAIAVMNGNTLEKVHEKDIERVTMMHDKDMSWIKGLFKRLEKTLDKLDKKGKCYE